MNMSELRWNINYPDTYTCRIDNLKFVIWTLKLPDDKIVFEASISIFIGDERFKKDITRFNTLQEAAKYCEVIYSNIKDNKA